MDILELTTEDYILTVRANGVRESFIKAALRNDGISFSTEYHFTGGNESGFKLVLCEGEKLSLTLAPSILNTPAHPVFFENKDYLFDVAFQNKIDGEPFVYSPIEEVKQAFISRPNSEKWFITGAINYGNEIGKTSFVLRYKKNGIEHEHTLNFEIFPVKLDYKNDYIQIIRDINDEFAALVLEVLKKTYSGFETGADVNNDIIWWSVFGGLYNDILLSAQLILNKPHNRLVNEIYYSRADRIKYLDVKLEEQIAENRNNAGKHYQVKRKILTLDTSENRYFKYIINYVCKKFIDIKAKFLTYYSLDITPDFREKLELIEKKFTTIAYHPFFKQVGDFRGLKQESLVMQKASGYSKLFRSWIILKKGIDFLDGVNRIELKSIAALYQIWCFLEVKNIIKETLNKEPEEANLAQVLIDGFTLKLIKGRQSRITFRKDTGDVVELYHELEYERESEAETLSHTLKQIPDIVLKVKKDDLKDDYQFTYLFDAKYRIDLKNAIHDYPPADAINQMHQYRDAIYYQSLDKRPKKEVIGAYVLFPGTDLEASIKETYYWKAIEQINIGAFPLLPGRRKSRNNALIKNFLNGILSDRSSEEILNEEIIPQKGLKYEDPNAWVLAGFTSGEDQKEYLLSVEAKIFHMPVYNKNGKVNTIAYLDKIKYFAPIVDGISRYFEIEEIKVLPRDEIFKKGEKLHKNSKDPYYVFVLRNPVELKFTIKNKRGGNRLFRYAHLSQLRNSKSIEGLHRGSI